MALNYGSGFITVTDLWPNVRDVAMSKSLALQYSTDTQVASGAYVIFAIDNPIVYAAGIFQGNVPAVADVSQSQNDAYKADFEGTYKAICNRPVSPVYTPTTGTFAGAGSTSLMVGGKHAVSGTVQQLSIRTSSSAPTAADNALVVVLSPNQQAIPTSNSPANTTSGIGVGLVTTSATTQVAVRNSTYTEPSSNAQRSISSANANDTSAGTGARQVVITYLDSTGAGPFTETVTLNGTSTVNTVSTTICFIESIVVSSVGSGGVNAGILTLFASTGGAGGTVATVNASDNTTFWSQHYVASGKTCHVTGLSGNNNNSSNGTILVLKSKVIGSSNKPEVQVSDFVRVGGATAQPVRGYDATIVVVGPARILCYATPEGTPNIINRAAFDFYDV